MIAIFYTCLAIWIAMAILDIAIGFLQLVAGLTLTLLSAALHVLVGFVEIVSDLWRIALSK